MNYVKLENGVMMPQLGYGTLHIPIAFVESCICDALTCGYRLLDSAAAYLNEKEIGRAVKNSHIPRAELFITSKVWVQDSGYEATMQAFYTSLQNLSLDYLDLYLIHQPYGDYYGSWRAMETLYKEGKIRAIGVCNFNPERFVDLCMNCMIRPMINQVEFHPFFQQKILAPIIKGCHCQLEAWGPFNEGQRDIFHHEVLKKIAEKHQKTSAQVMLRWHIQQDVVAIPKTIHRDRMQENMDIWDFTLDEQDMEEIAMLDLGYSEIIDHQCYATAKLLNKHKIHD